MKLLQSVWAAEPVRAALYSVGVVLVGALVVKGVVSADVVNYLLAAGALVLGVPAVEVARKSVAPVAE